MQSRSLFAATLLALALYTRSTPARAQEEDNEKPIREAFLKLGTRPPELGWLLPSGDLVSEIFAQNLTALSVANDTQVATRTGSIPASAVKAFVKKHQVDCDQVDEPSPTPMYRYTVKLSAPHYPLQLLVVPGDVESKIVSGFEEYKASLGQLAPIWKSMDYASPQKHLVHSIRQIASPFFYTFVATYSKDRTILKKGIFLQDSTGKILGHEIETLNGQNECDGCAVLSYKDGIRAAYDLENLLSIPSFPYPLVLIDSSTAEGRATELFTFTQNGQPSRYRKYEYMVTCILGSPAEQAAPGSR